MEKPNIPAPVPVERPKTSYWRRMGGGSLTISLIVHAVLLAVGLFWILNIIPAEPEKTVQFTSSGGGGGTPALKSAAQKKNVKSMVQRVAAVGSSSNFTLPEPDKSSSLSSLGSLGAAGGGGLGGGGTGGGRGEGKGRGIGSGFGDGMGNGPPVKVNPFGIQSLTPNALVGTFYDLKQTDKRKPTNISTQQTQEVIREFVNRGWKETSLSREYYQAPQKLYQTKIYIPMMPAEGAPAAFNCEMEVERSRWVIVYRGTVTPPHSGKYRFVGAGDDVLVVRFNNKHVFDHGFYGGTTGTHLSGMMNVLTSGKDDNGALKDSPMKLPIKFYKYDTTAQWNRSIGGLAVGPEFEAKSGMSYPIEILLSEIPGGLFCASLMIEQVGEEYKKASTGSPILPIFRIGFTEPAPTTDDNAPPYDPKGPSWKIVEGARKSGI